jgi:hypothetical protein
MRKLTLHSYTVRILVPADVLSQTSRENKTERVSPDLTAFYGNIKYL